MLKKSVMIFVVSTIMMFSVIIPTHATPTPKEELIVTMILRKEIRDIERVYRNFASTCYDQALAEYTGVNLEESERTLQSELANTIDFAKAHNHPIANELVQWGSTYKDVCSENSSIGDIGDAKKSHEKTLADLLAQLGETLVKLIPNAEIVDPESAPTYYPLRAYFYLFYLADVKECWDPFYNGGGNPHGDLMRLPMEAYCENVKMFSRYLYGLERWAEFSTKGEGLLKSWREAQDKRMQCNPDEKDGTVESEYYKCIQESLRLLTAHEAEAKTVLEAEVAAIKAGL